MSEANRITGRAPPWWCPSSGDETGPLVLQRWLSKWSSRNSQGWEDEFPRKNPDWKHKKKEWLVLSGNCGEQKENTNHHYLINGDDSNVFGSFKASPKAANYNFFSICNFHLRIFLFILHLSTFLVAQTSVERKLLLEGHLHENIYFLFHAFALMLFLDVRIIWP